ncbi:MAG: hypothetical protein D3909_12495, partial [Candidatus Electrothrix sp. ATG1]|nr:hypothetical protein [Candidatus Electrothrix sp. ATG1]
GTSSLFAWLSEHPDICPTREKETNFLVDKDSPLFDPKSNFSTQGWEGYAKWFRDSPENKVTLDASPEYMYQQTALTELGRITPVPKIIFLLRKPSVRALSAYRFFKEHHSFIDNNMSFSGYIDSLCEESSLKNHHFPHKQSVSLGYYVHFLDKWATAVGKEQLGIFLFEELRENPAQFIHKVCDFLNLSTEFYKGYNFRPRNITLKVRFQWLDLIKYNLVNRFLPYGSYRRIAGRIYSLINRKKSGFYLSEKDRETLQRLDVMYADSTSLLTDDYGLDTSIWESTWA